MNNLQEQVIRIMIEKGNELLTKPDAKMDFTTGNMEADKLVSDIEKFPHAFVLACIMDRQVKAEKAWLIPFEVSREIGGFEFSKLRELSEDMLKEIFNRKSLHRFNDTMAKNFYLGIQKIHEKYNDDASNIWRCCPRSATIVRRFLEFEGVGVKIATMATNILVRDYKVPVKDHICIDISPDVHVKRVFRRLGFISKNAGNEELIYCAREFNPEYPGVFDLPCWEIGRNWCKPHRPQCEDCYLAKYCPKMI